MQCSLFFNLSHIMLKNKQTSFKNLALLTPQDFWSMVGYFSTLMVWETQKHLLRCISLRKNCPYSEFFTYCLHLLSNNSRKQGTLMLSWESGKLWSCYVRFIPIKYQINKPNSWSKFVDLAMRGLHLPLSQIFQYLMPWEQQKLQSSARKILP